MLGDNKDTKSIHLGNIIYGYGKPFGSNGCHIVLNGNFLGKYLKVEIVDEEEAEKEVGKKLEEKAGGKQVSLW